MKNKYLFMFIALFIMVISISCTFAEDTDDATVGTTNDNDASLDEEASPDTSISLNVNKEDIDVDNTVVVSGNVKDNDGTALADSDVNISIKGIAYGENKTKSILKDVIKSDEQGSYSYNFTPSIGGTLKIKVTNPITSESQKIEVNVEPKSTIVTLDPIHQITVNETLNISGRLTDGDGNALRYTGVGVHIGGMPYGESEYTFQKYLKEYTRTDKDGYYSYEYVPTVGGRLYVTTYYPGYHYYGFNYSRSGIYVLPKATKVNLDSIDDIDYGESVTITGTLSDADNKPLRSTSVGMLLNGENKTYVRTDKHGAYTINITPKNSGDINLTVYYPGYHYYGFTQNSTMFKVLGKETTLTLIPIENMTLGESALITGKLTDKDNNPISGTNISVSINSDSIELTTNDDGTYSYNYTPTYPGNYYIDAMFDGFEAYYPSNSVNGTFRVTGNISNTTMNMSEIAGYNPVLRFSTQWYSYGTGIDLDSYCIEPNGNTICYHSRTSNSSGKLMSDTATYDSPIATEHIIFTAKNMMPSGTYIFKVQNFNSDVTGDGFISEIEFDNKTYCYDYNQRINPTQYVEVAKVTLSNGTFTISNTIPATIKE